MRTIRLLSLFALLFLVGGGCSYEPYGDLVCSTDSDCGNGQCVDGLCVGSTPDVDSGPGAAAAISVTPMSLTLEPGETATVTATVTDADGTTIPDADIVWASDSESVATVAGGVVTGVAEGAAAITATVEGLVAQVDVVVETPAARVEVQPSPLALGVGISEQLTATVFDANDNELMGREVVWASQDAAIASVDQTGLARGVAEGNTTITATSGDVSVEVPVEVTVAPPATIEITPTDGRVSVATGARFEALVRDEAGRLIDQASLDAPFLWDIGRTSWQIHVVFPAGVDWLFDFNPEEDEVGTATVSVELTVGDVTVSDSLEVEVYVPAIDTVVAAPETLDLEVGATSMATVVATDEDGNEDMLQTPVWESSDTDVATVDANGNIEAVGPGTATITVTVGGVSDTIDVTVEFYLASISSGADHSCGLTPGGVAYCWGSNGAGQLGDGTTDASSTPVAADTVETFEQIVAGDSVTCALTAAGSAYCWGQDEYVGNDATGADVLSPAPVAGGHTFTLLAAEFQTTCGITTANEIFCWGIGSNGQIGDGNEMNVDVPTQVTKPAGTTGWKEVEVGDNHVCAIDLADGTFCWGQGAENRLGTVATDDSSTPIAVGTLETFQTLELSQKSGCALNGSNALFCWGDDNESVTGTGLGGDVQTPTAVQGAIVWASFDMGTQHACGIEMATNLVYCWGKKDNGRLGFTSAQDVGTPTTTTAMFTAKAVDLGDDFSCGIDMSDIPFCWGQSSETPTRVWPLP